MLDNSIDSNNKNNRNNIRALRIMWITLTLKEHKPPHILSLDQSVFWSGKFGINKTQAKILEIF